NEPSAVRPIPTADPSTGGVETTHAEVAAGLGTLPPPLPAVASAQEEPAHEGPSWRDTAVAAFKQGDPVYNLWNRYVLHPDVEAPAPPGYDAMHDIKGYEAHAEAFAGSTSPAETQVIKDRYDAENDVNRTVEQAGAAGIMTSLALGVIAPTSIAMLAIPGMEAFGVESRLAKIGGTVAVNVGLGEAQQATLAASRETTSYGEGIGARIGVNTLLAGVLGTIATRIPPEEHAALVASTRASLEKDNTWTIPTESTSGAMRRQETTLDQES